MAEGILFEISEKNEGRFVYPDAYEDYYLEVYDLFMMHDESDRVDRSYLLGLRKIIKSAPDLIDAYIRIADYYYERGDYKKTKENALAAVAIANRVIPENFAGTIDFEDFDNRPYFKAISILIDIAIARKNHTDAIFLIDKLIAFDNLDHLGLSNWLGSELLRAGELDRAMQVFRDEVDYYPPYHYEMALVHLARRDFVKATTSLRIGIARNPILADLLFTDYMCVDDVWDHYSENMLRDTFEYTIHYGESFKTHNDFKFLLWIYHHSKVLQERSVIRSFAEKLPDTGNMDMLLHQTQVLAQIDNFIQNIDDQSSMEMTKAITNACGELTLPQIHVFCV